MPFDFHNKDRINNLIEELRELRYKKLHDIKEFNWFEDDGRIGNNLPQGDSVIVEPGFRWKGWDQYNWICATLTIPEELMGDEVVGLFDFGVPSGSGNNSHFESLLYLNGNPYQAADGNHKEVFLNPQVNGSTLDLKFRVWSGLNGGGRPTDMVMEIVRAQFGVLDHDTDALYYLALTALETYEILDSGHEYKEWILNSLVQCFRLLDYTHPGSETFYNSAKEAYTYLEHRLDGRGKPDVNVTLLGHTHIDVAWLWRLRHTREKAARSFSTVNRLMDRYDHYNFLQTQAQLYEYIKTDYPQIYELIKERVAQGRWEPSGSMWVECDCNVASGESIIRQILVGKNFFKKEFGYDNDFLWLPDVFGYSWAMPQILKKSGIDTFMTTKISWNDTNRMPYDTFLWRGIDGTEVTTHFITTTDSGSSYYTYNGDTSPRSVKGVWDNYSNKDLNKDLIISYGYGDGGGGPNRDMIETAACLNKIPGLPRVTFESGTQYFNRLNRTLKENPMDGYIPVWDGELYLEFHRGTYTSQAYNKKMNRKMEYALRNIEIESVISSAFLKGSYDYDSILEAWKIVLCHQFHDILPGSSIHEVYEDSHVEYEKAKAILKQVSDKNAEMIYQREENSYTVFNNSNWERDTFVKIAQVDNKVFTDKDGQVLPTIWKDKEAYIQVKGLPPFAYKTIYQSDKECCLETSINESEVETQFYIISWNEAGQLTGIYDKEAQREVLPKGKCANVLQVFEDKPRCFDAWEMESTLDLKKEIITNCTDIRVTKNVIGIFVSFTWKYHDSVINQTMCLYNEKKRIDFKTNIDWQQHQKLLKTAFPVDIRAVDARFDIQNGNIRRPITCNNSWEAAKFEVAAHKWVDLWETGYGMAVLNDCKYGHDIKEDTIRLTLLKSAIDPDYSADTGSHEFIYSILPHHKEWYESKIEQEAFDLNNPLEGVKGQSFITDTSLFSFSYDHIVVDAIKRAENSEDIVIRFHEYAGARGSVKITTKLNNIHSWCESNLMEEPQGEFVTSPIEVSIKPYEIKTILIKSDK